MSSTPPRLELSNNNSMTCGSFTHDFITSGLLMQALTVPIANLPTDMQDRPSTFEDGKRLTFLGASIFKITMATSYFTQSRQNTTFWTQFFDNGLATDDIFASYGRTMGISRQLVAADGDHLTPDFWESLSSAASQQNCPIAGALQALIGALWVDCLNSEPKKDALHTVQRFLRTMGLNEHEQERQRSEEDLRTAMERYLNE